MERTTPNNAQRTSIEDLDAGTFPVGFELSDQEMRLTSGGKMAGCTATDAGAGDCDADPKPHPK